MQQMTERFNKLLGLIPGMGKSGNEILKEVRILESSMGRRRQAFNRWYNLLKQVDELKQEGMQSFVGNDPRTMYNMANYLLHPRPLVHHLTTDDGAILDPEQLDVANRIQQYFARVWSDIDRSDGLRGRESWFGSAIGMTLATGWYAWPYGLDSSGSPFVDYWNPATVFPEYDEDPAVGLLRLGRIRTVTAAQAARIVHREGWTPPSSALTASKFIEAQLWKVIPGEGVAHGVSMDNTIVKPFELIPGLRRIPVLVGATGGLPDTGVIDSKWMESVGQSILATNEAVFANLNKEATFLQQLVHDVANPRTFEKGTNNTQLNVVQTWYNRGAHYKLPTNADIGVIAMPGIPPELTNAMFQLRGMQQRGGFSDLTFGNVLQEVSSIMITQAAEAAQQLLSPFHSTIQFAITEVTNSWYQAFLANPELQPESWNLEKVALENTRITSVYSIRIPGDLQNRLQMARLFNPRFQAPLELVMELLIPEILNVPEALAKLEGEQSKIHPLYREVQLIQAFREGARRARRMNNLDAAKMFEILVQRMTQRLGQGPMPDERLQRGGRAGAPRTGAQSEAQGVLPAGPRQQR